jgi:hypothetical protein
MARAWLEKSRRREPSLNSDTNCSMIAFIRRRGVSRTSSIFYLAGGPRGISAGFGIRNPDAEAFAVQEILKCFSDDTMARALQLEYDERSSCTMRFGFSLSPRPQGGER